MLMQNFGGTKKEYYGKFESGLIFCIKNTPTKIERAETFWPLFR